jgi:peptidoglycan hydrolase-like protein with peptidoglycan-binding domain
MGRTMEIIAYLHHATALEAQDSPEQINIEVLNVRLVSSFLTTVLLTTLPFAMSSGFMEKAYASVSTIRYGDSSGTVTSLQRSLAHLGYFDGEVTGNFLEITEEAVMRFQRDRGLDNDGVVGKRTWAALGDNRARGAVSFSASIDNPLSRRQERQLRDDYRGMWQNLLNEPEQNHLIIQPSEKVVPAAAVDNLQSILSGLNYLDRLEETRYIKAGQVENSDARKDYGLTTQEAVIRVQRDCNLPESGTVDPYTKACLEEMVYSSQ